MRYLLTYRFDKHWMDTVNNCAEVSQQNRAFCLSFILKLRKLQNQMEQEVYCRKGADNIGYLLNTQIPQCKCLNVQKAK